MKAKILLTFSLLIGAPFAYGVEPVEKRFDLYCEGSQGGIYFGKHSRGMTYAADTASTKVSGTVKFYSETEKEFETGGASIIKPTYEHGKVWLSVHASKGHKKWIPEHTKCIPTRRPDQCIEVKIPGHYIKVHDEYYNVLVDITDGNEVKFMNFDSTGQDLLKTLGENTQCHLEFFKD